MRFVKRLEETSLQCCSINFDYIATTSKAQEYEVNLKPKI